MNAKMFGQILRISGFVEARFVEAYRERGNAIRRNRVRAVAASTAPESTPPNKQAQRHIAHQPPLHGLNKKCTQLIG